MFNKLLSTMMTILLASSAHSQTYTEITQRGWGQGMAGSNPVIVDLDQDGRLDLIVGEEAGNLNHYQQDPAGSPAFTLVTRFFSEINGFEVSAPCFADIDRDGLLDLIVGAHSEGLRHFEQSESDPMSFTVRSDRFYNGIDIGSYLMPAITDLDHNGLFDLLIGIISGELYHYEQYAADSDSFVFISNSFCGIEVTD